ncbi:hypothetical protein [Ensifer aridi]|uniref:hypothetical protein n=1 Tax=Ensifer aridi TaxID=1708715 RepID=UPI000A11A1B0|nr:hypothetical protein [Ensifer aridi]
MSLFTKKAEDTFAPYDSAGNPREIVPQDAQVWGTEVERLITSFRAGGGIIFPDKATMDATLTYAANQMAWVIGDGAGVYRKIGASGTGSWQRLGDLPYSFIKATDAGVGTPNAIQATTSIPVSSSALIWMNIFETNGPGPVTVQFNSSGPTYTIKTNSGNDPAAGGLPSGIIVAGMIVDSTFRLISDQASAAVLGAAEAAKNAAQAAAEAAEAAAAGVTLPSAVANTYLRQKADTSGYETKTSAEVVADLNSVPVQIAGGDSAARNAVARYGDTIDIREFGFNLSGAAGTETTNNAAIDRLIAHATLNPGMVYRARKGDVIRLDTAGGGKTIPKSKLRLEGAEFHWAGNFGGTASPVLMLGQFVDFDALTAAVPAGGLFRRMFRLIGDNRGDYIEVECENQVANWSGSNLDYAVAIYGHRNKVRSVKTKNVDWGAFVYGDGSAGFPQLDTVIGEFDIENYAVGFVIRNVTRFFNPLARVRGKSPNALPDPGYNACLIEGARDSVFGDYQLFDAGEHNLRFGGVHSGEQLTRNCSLGNLLSGRAGQCGFKIWSGLNTDIIRGMTFGPMNIFDCGLYAQGLGNPPNFNDFGVMVQGALYSSFDVINVYKQSAAYSAFDAAYFSQCQDVQVAQLNGFGPKRNILRISEYNGNGTDSNATNSLAFTRVNGSGHEAEGIVVQVPTNSMRDVSIDDFYIIGGTDAFKWDGALARAAQPCYFRGGARAFSGAKFNAPGGTNIKVVDKYV